MPFSFSFRTDLSLAWNSPSPLDWLTSKPERSTHLSLPSMRSRVCTSMPNVCWFLVTGLGFFCLQGKHFTSWVSCLFLTVIFCKFHMWVLYLYYSHLSLPPHPPVVCLCSWTLLATSQGLYSRDVIPAEIFLLQGPSQWGCTLKHVEFGKMLSIHNIHLSKEPCSDLSVRTHSSAYNAHVHMCILTCSRMHWFLRQVLNIALSVAVL